MRWNILLAALVALIAAAVLVTTEAPIEDPIWWYTNETPPRLTISGPSGPLRGPAEATIGLEPSDRARLVSVSLDGQPLASVDKRVTVDSSQLPDGPHHVEVVARDSSRRQNQATATWTFVSDNTPPKLDVQLDPNDGPREGHTLVIRIRSDKPTASLSGTVGNHALRLEPDNRGGYWALEGVSPDPPSTSLSLRLAASDALGNSASWEHTWPVRRTQFPEDDLELDPGQIAAQARADENSRLGALYHQPDGPKRWDGRFRLPVEGSVTTEFGTHRSYEYHPGTDFGAPLGAPVRAPAPGVVVFEGPMPARGNVLVLDHGAGVFTTYAHLQRFEVEPGTDVTPGQLIARVGTTGFSTGPHLHWELWVDGSNVDPVEWTQRSFP